LKEAEVQSVAQRLNKSFQVILNAVKKNKELDVSGNVKTKSK